MKLPRILLAAGLAALALPAAANADSIVYIDQGNVWSATPDGARKVQLTTGGGWHSPTQADDGTIAAVQGAGPIQVMARDGRPLRTITTQPARSGDGGTFAPRPVAALVLARRHEDRLRVRRRTRARWPRPAARSSARRSTRTRTSRRRRRSTSTATSTASRNPEWVTNSRTLVFGGYGRQVAIDDLGAGDYSHEPWMVPNGDMGDGEVTRDGTRLAVTVRLRREHEARFFAVTGDVKTEFPPAYPESACATTNGDEKLRRPDAGRPTAPGSRTRAARASRSRASRSSAPAVCDGAERRLILSATGSEPDWGPADPPAAAYTPRRRSPGADAGARRRTPAAARSSLIGKVTAKALRKGLAGEGHRARRRAR